MQIRLSFYSPIKCSPQNKWHDGIQASPFQDQIYDHGGYVGFGGKSGINEKFY